MPTEPEPMNGSATTSPALLLCKISVSLSATGFLLLGNRRTRGVVSNVERCLGH